MDIREALKHGIGKLRDSRIESYTLAAELLLLHAMERDRTWLYSHPEEQVSPQQEQKYFEFIQRRAAGEPVQHLTGKQEFWSLDFAVSPDVLIPRPETEHLIEVALDRLAVREIRAGRPPKNTGEGLLVADIGTGSGCIAVALATELPAANFIATDISPAALAVARRNATRHLVSERIQFIECNLLEGSPRQFDLIVSNPPYIGLNEMDTLAREVRDHEPVTALYGGEEGYELYAELITQAARCLASGGLLVLELGHKSLPAVQPLLDAPTWARAAVTNDLSGIPRVVAAERL
ncbi:MAG TPA: peptide chain release factor N(5)-glutamine methyltransferase [Candidatus Saccharimonadales bacterium]|nr:peptide chain release factor N(5)-glutamine methyltransferase [Candidatus Saccharimonadales bacterium]